MAKTPAKPMEVSMIGNVYVTMMSPVQNVRAQIAIQTPRTLVGKISEQRILGMGPKPITKQQKYITTLMVENTAFRIDPMLTTLETTRMMSDPIKTGIVERSSRLSQ